MNCLKEFNELFHNEFNELSHKEFNELIPESNAFNEIFILYLNY